MGAVIAMALGKIISGMGAMFLGWKTVMVALITVVLGVVIYNVVSEIVGELLDFAMEQISAISQGGLPSVTLQLSGIGAWLAEKLRLDDQVALMITFVTAKWLVVKIPFLKW